MLEIISDIAYFAKIVCGSKFLMSEIVCSTEKLQVNCKYIAFQSSESSLRSPKFREKTSQKSFVEKCCPKLVRSGIFITQGERYQFDKSD